MKKLFTILAMAACSTSFAQIVNGNMESWRTYTSGTTSGLQIPIAWASSDSFTNSSLAGLVCSTCTFQRQTFQCDTAHGGTYAARIVTRNVGGSFGIIPGNLTNGTIAVSLSGSFSISGGTAVTQRIDSVTAWLRYIPQGADSGGVSVQAIMTGAGAGGADSVLGTGSDATTAGNNYVLMSGAYVKHTYVMTYNGGSGQPDHIQIGFTSSQNAGQDFSMMYIDDVNMYMHSLSIPLLNSSDVACYPNPAGKTLTVHTAQYKGAVAELYNLLGQKVAAQSLESAITEMNVSGLAGGMYFLHVTDANNAVVYQTKIVKE